MINRIRSFNMLILPCRGKPYVIVFVGVNGVGKSTNLAKIAYWLVQNKMKVCKSKPCVSLLVHIPQQVAQPPRNVMHWTPDPICTACLKAGRLRMLIKYGNMV